MFALQSERALRNFKWRHHDYAMTQMGGVHTRVPSTLTNSHPITSRADAETYIKRLERVETLKKKVVDRLAAQEASKIQPPRIVYYLGLARSEERCVGKEGVCSCSYRRSRDT